MRQSHLLLFLQEKLLEFALTPEANGMTTRNWIAAQIFRHSKSFTTKADTPQVARWSRTYWREIRQWP